jgi:hypothetical protein
LSGKKQRQTTGANFVKMLPFKDNKALNYQGKDEGTIIVIAQHELELDFIMVRNPPPPPPMNF